ncbi:hypothetical protein Tsubulata_019286 [Turnera subulata]|uniref:Uncharacterized protein n=1 Tax=Turnera subulata TaxID=218843 RepID=A0A9Q0JBC1_9ROSI|nr:hypothetical protein Tsubulata_019286 [Turnera subulata]
MYGLASLQLQHYSWFSCCVATRKPSSKFSFSINASTNNESGSRNPPPDTVAEQQPTVDDRIKLAFEKAKAYKKISTGDVVEDSAGSSSSRVSSIDTNEQLPDGKTKGVGGDGVKDATKKGGTGKNLGNGVRNTSASSSKEVKLSVSSVDFLGLDFADKKRSRRELPPGLRPVRNPFPEGELPEVEIILGDTSKFGGGTTPAPPVPESDSSQQQENSDVYKPKVSTWGVFPRPRDISKTNTINRLGASDFVSIVQLLEVVLSFLCHQFGGGRTIRPGDVIETAEERASKDERTRQLLAAYRKKIGSTSIDPEVKLKCDKALEDGNSLMNSGKLKDALPYYQMVMDKLPFESELHGLAGLQWSICQDSLCRANDARLMYEKLQSHPNAEVSKRAKQFVFSFQAMEMMKFSGSNYLPKTTGYESYFDAFVENKAAAGIIGAGAEAEDDDALRQALPYMFFLVSPLFIVLLIAVQRGSTN